MSTDDGHAHRTQLRQRPPAQAEDVEADVFSPTNECQHSDDNQTNPFASSTSGTLAARQQRRCWVFFIGLSCAFTLVIVVLICFILLREHRQMQAGVNAPPTARKKSRHHSLEYFVLCVIGGVLSGIPHVLMAPVDIVKCRLQVGEYRSIHSGLLSLWNEALTAASAADVNASGRRSSSPLLLIRKCLAVLGVLYRGWVPTIIGYCLQGALKFGFYEYFRYRFAMMIPFHLLLTYLTWVFVFASACAELIADVALAPWETVKVRMQTQPRNRPNSPTLIQSIASADSMRDVMTSIWFFEGGMSAYFRCLVPLWCRQVPYTVVKFTTFEKSVVLIRWLLFSPSSAHPSPHSPDEGSGGNAGWQRLVVALLAGYLAGTLCAIVSQPADVVVSKLTAAQSNDADDKRQGKKANWLTIVKEIGFRGTWKGLSARVLLVGTLSGAQWAIYDSFKMLSGAV